MIRQIRQHRLQAAATCVLIIQFGLMTPAISEDGATPSIAQGPLDGMSFSGGLGPEGQAIDRNDTLYFNDGQFWSANCVPCGFKPGAYWVRTVDDAIQFRGTLESDERGKFHYTGIVRDGRITANINWRHKRWYWNINRNFQFEGTVAKSDPPGTAKLAAKLAGTAQPDPVRCNPGR